MNYRKEFKEEALKLSDEIGLKRLSAVSNPVLHSVGAAHKAKCCYQSSEISLMTDDEAKQRITELEREIAELRKANDILKDALGFFAKDRKK